MWFVCKGVILVDVNLASIDNVMVIGKTYLTSENQTGKTENPHCKCVAFSNVAV